MTKKLNVLAWASAMCIFVSTGTAAAAQTVVAAGSTGFAAKARAVATGAELRVDGVALDRQPAALELKRFEVFTPDAQIVVQGDGGGSSIEVPHNAYFRGKVAGDPNSVAMLAVHPGGGARGLVVAAGQYWLLNGSGLAAQRVDPENDFAGHSFRCDTEDGEAVPQLFPGAPGGAAPGQPVPAAVALGYTARIAIDTDYEFLQLFSGNTTNATNYVADLFAFSSSIYEAEVGTSLEISYLRLWTTSSDPWSTTTSCSTVLSEFRSYWIANESGIQRTTAHFLSGKNTGCGIAYIGALCNNSYGYGASGGLDINFNPANPNVVWDIIVVSHEIGHNFNSPHTHCYAGIGGVPDPVDQCYGSEGGCYAGPTSLPCAAGPGNGCGTIMSYCHLLSGGFGNMTLTFGLGHPYGVSPDRVPTRMYNYVVQQASYYPGCLDVIAPGPVLSVSKNGTGGGTVTSNPLGISCGSDCSESYAQDTVVTLTATPNGSSEFAGWSGNADCTDGVVTMNADKNCVATFNSTCGNGVRQGSEQCDGADLGGATCGGCAGTVKCTASCTLDYSGCTNDVCDASETCASCAADCVTGGAVCGNGICETADGENCATCSADCRGKRNGKTSGRYCCGTGVQYAVGCSPQLCGASCVTTPASGCCGDGICNGSESSASCVRDCGSAPYCGDGFCNGGETSCSCSGDCGAPPLTETSCSDGVDNDCDGLVDCADGNCSAAAACVCKSLGTACTSNSQCCSGNCGKVRNKRVCR